jgi:hypothetical protein
MPGGGGNWLRHALYCLQHGSNPVANANGVSYDDEPNRSTDVIVKGHELYNFSNDSIYLMSTVHLFNIALSASIKNSISDKTVYDTLQEKFQYFTNQAVFCMNDNMYNTNITLNHDWLYNDRDRFMNVFYNILNAHDVVYKQDTDVFNQLIDNYITTQPVVTEYYDNYNSIVWLGWCHAVATMHDYIIQTDLSKCDTLADIANALYPCRDICLDTIRKFIIPGSP